MTSLTENVQDLIAGTAGGIATVIVGHPFDTAKVRIQTQDPANRKYNGIIDMFRKMAAEEGIRGFYRGASSPMIGEGFFNAVQFFAWGICKAAVFQSPFPALRNATDDPDDELSVAGYFIAGGLVGLSSCIVECPIDLFKTQLQVQIFSPRPHFSTLRGCISSIVRENGILGIYQGFLSTVLRSGPACASFFGTYEAMRKFLSYGQRRSLRPADVLIAGGVAGSAYWLSTFPLDTIKSALQGDSYIKSQRKYAGFIDCTRKLWREDGLSRFFRGLSPCLVRSMPANSACFFAYEYAKKAMETMIPAKRHPISL